MVVSAESGQIVGRGSRKEIGSACLIIPFAKICGAPIRNGHLPRFAGSYDILYEISKYEEGSV